MKTLLLLKRWMLLFLLSSVGFSLSGYCQKQDGVPPVDKRDPRRLFDPLIPIRDTVIMRGEEIYIGAYLFDNSCQKIRAVEVDGYGKSKKSDVEKGYFAVKLKPKQTTTYVIRYDSSIRDITPMAGKLIPYKRTVYVAKTEAEKKKFEKIIEEQERERLSKFKTVILK
jgi:hypothetical protein